MNSIFTFDHGQRKLNKAIGVQESYMDDLQEQIANLLKNHIFDENKELKEDLPSLNLISLLRSVHTYHRYIRLDW